MGPIPELFSARFSPHFQEIPQIMSTPLTRRNLRHFQEIQQIMSTKSQTWHSWPRKKFRNRQAWLGGPGLVLSPPRRPNLVLSPPRLVPGPPGQSLGWSQGLPASPWPGQVPPKMSVRAKIIKNGRKRVQNRRFGLKIGPRESYSHFGPVGTGPGPKK